MTIKYKDLLTAYSIAIKDDSPLYNVIAERMSTDKELKELLSPVMINMQSMPLLMAAVLSYLYDHQHELQLYYLNFTDTPRRFDDNGFKLLKELIIEKHELLFHRMENHDLKKNIVERAAILIPIFHHIVDASQKEQFNVIELGSKAGLVLNYDWYGYTFNKDLMLGDTKRFNMKVKLKGYEKLNQLQPLKHPHHKFGISKQTIDITNDEEFNWMKSLLYPEDTKFRSNLMTAREIMKEHPVDLYEGDELLLLEKVLKELPDGEPIIIFHLHLAKYWSDDKKADLLALIKSYSTFKEIYHIHHQLFGSDIFLDYFKGERLIREKLANFRLDKMKIEWLLNQPIKL